MSYAGKNDGVRRKSHKRKEQGSSESCKEKDDEKSRNVELVLVFAADWGRSYGLFGLFGVVHGVASRKSMADQADE